MCSTHFTPRLKNIETRLEMEHRAKVYLNTALHFKFEKRIFAHGKLYPNNVLKIVQ